jgi:MerR family mercuric resistance operon transcriptional regulator
MDGMTRSEVAERADVNPETLRYYERKELIPEPPRSSGGFRLYDESYVNRLRFIQRAQDLGFTLAEIKDLLDLRTGDEATCRDVKARADAKIEDVQAKIRDLERIRDALRVLSHACAGGLGPTSDCPILDAMADENALNRALS